MPIVAPTESNAKKVPQAGPAVSGTDGGKGGGKGGKGAAGPQGFVERVQQLRRWFTTYRQLFVLSLAVNVLLVCLAATGNFAWGRNNAGTLATCFVLLLPPTHVQVYTPPLPRKNVNATSRLLTIF